MYIKSLQSTIAQKSSQVSALILNGRLFQSLLHHLVFSLDGIWMCQTAKTFNGKQEKQFHESSETKEMSWTSLYSSLQSTAAAHSGDNSLWVHRYLTLFHTVTLLSHHSFVTDHCTNTHKRYFWKCFHCSVVQPDCLQVIFNYKDTGYQYHYSLQYRYQSATL